MMQLTEKAKVSREKEASAVVPGSFFSVVGGGSLGGVSTREGLVLEGGEGFH